MIGGAAYACVLGGVDLLRALGLAGIPCASVSPVDALPRFSRFTRAKVSWHDPLGDPDALVESLIGFARSVAEPPVLFYQGDGDTLFISRNRDRLAPHVRFVIPDADLVEDLVDKARFQALAKRLALPVPSAVLLEPGDSIAADQELVFPALVKPVARQLATWQPFAGDAKAVQVDSAAALEAIWCDAARYGTAVLVQELIPGAENRIESYHVYVDGDGEIAAEFTGRKARTYPVHFGQSTALELTAAADVEALGREIVRRMGLRGVAKLDFKRHPSGKLYLLEVNPRFNLWHHLGAVGGVNLPAMVYADLTGGRRPPRTVATPGVKWSRPLADLQAARAAGEPLSVWLRWTIAARARSGLALDDPLLPVGWAARRLQGLRVGGRARAASTSV